MRTAEQPHGPPVGAATALDGTHRVAETGALRPPGTSTACDALMGGGVDTREAAQVTAEGERQPVETTHKKRHKKRSHRAQTVPEDPVSTTQLESDR